MVIIQTRYGAFAGHTALSVSRLIFGQSTSLDGTTVIDFYGNPIDQIEIIQTGENK